MYIFSTKLDAEKHGCNRFERLIPAAEGAGLIRFYPPNPPNSRSILSLPQNGTNVERRAVSRADAYADTRAEPFAELRAVACADDCAEEIVPMQKAVQSLVQKDKQVEES